MRIRHVLVTLVAALAVTGCGSPEPAGPATAPPAAPAQTTPAEPRTADAAKTAAQRSFDRFTAGDYAGVWDLMSAKGRKAITRQQYADMLSACENPGAGMPIEVADTRLEGDGAVAVVKVLGFTKSYTMSYEQGRWLIDPTPQLLAELKDGGDKAVARAKAPGGCD